LFSKRPELLPPNCQSVSTSEAGDEIFQVLFEAEFNQDDGPYLLRSVAFRPCLTAGLALSRLLILLPELYVKRLFLVNGTEWYKAEKSSKKEHPDTSKTQDYPQKTSC
jgi:hypothetical protein